MKTITKHFDTLKKAETFQERLYCFYNHVRLVKAPFFTEDGVYTWECE